MPAPGHRVQPGLARPKADAASLAHGPLSAVCDGLCQSVRLGWDAIPCPLSVSRFPSLCRSLCVSLSLALPAYVCVFVCARTRVCECLSVCLHLPLAISESVCDPWSFPSLSLLTPGFRSLLLCNENRKKEPRMMVTKEKEGKAGKIEQRRSEVLSENLR